MKYLQRKVASAICRSDRQEPASRGGGHHRLANCVAAAALVAAAVASTPTLAALGQSATSVETDRIQVKASSVRQVAHGSYTVHELSTELGGVVREYVSPAGQVFAVTWHGFSKPNLQQVLGAHFATVAAAERSRPGGHAHQAVSKDDFVYESTGHMRSFHGRAYLTDAIPAGVTTNDIQ